MSTQTNMETKADAELERAAATLLDAAMAYWKEYQRVTGGSAVVWVQDIDGRLVVLTRGEYTATIMENVNNLRRTGPIPFDRPAPEGGRR